MYAVHSSGKMLEKKGKNKIWNACIIQEYIEMCIIIYIRVNNFKLNQINVVFIGKTVV